MRIEALKINGVPEPLGFALPFVEASFKVRDTESKKARSIRLRLLDAGGKLLTGGTVDCTCPPPKEYPWSLFFPEESQ